MKQWIISLLAVLVLSTPAMAALPDIPTELKSQSTSTAKLTILEFSAPWCASCKKLKPVVGELNKQYGPKLSIVHVNVDDPTTQKYQKQFNLVSIPTYVLYDAKKKPIEKIEREISATELKDLVAKRIK